MFYLLKMNIIWKPTEACNLSCKYCYVGDTPTDFTSIEDMLLGIRKFANFFSKRKLEITLHGGEPCLSGTEYLKKIVNLVQELKNNKNNISLSLQSNGTLFTTELLDFLLDNEINIGLSLDGPPEINGLTRVFNNGEDSYKKTIDTIKRIKDREKNVGVICVVSKANIDNLTKVYDHFKEIGLTGVNFNPLLPSGRAKINSHLAITEDEWNNTMSILYDYTQDDEYKIRVDPFAKIRKAVLTGKTTGCQFMYSCQESFISVKPNGDVYPCGRFDHDKTMCYGNIFQDSIGDIMRHPLRIKLLERGKNLETQCKTCEYDNICYGGCLHTAYESTGDPMKKSLFCQKPLFEAVYKSLEQKIYKELQNIRH